MACVYLHMARVFADILFSDTVLEVKARGDARTCREEMDDREGSGLHHTQTPPPCSTRRGAGPWTARGAGWWRGESPKWAKST